MIEEFIYRTYHKVAWWFTILSQGWDLTSPCKGASISAMSPYWISPPPPPPTRSTHACERKTDHNTWDSPPPSPISSQIVCGYFVIIKLSDDFSSKNFKPCFSIADRGNPGSGATKNSTFFFYACPETRALNTRASYLFLNIKVSYKWWSYTNLKTPS